MPELEALAWYEHGYAVLVGALIALGGGCLAVWMLVRWPGALWRRLRGHAYMPGELLWTSIGGLAALLLVSLGSGMILLERGLRDFQSFEDAELAGMLHLQRTRSAVRAAWQAPGGAWTHTWPTRCSRLELQGEFIDWHRLAQALGFRNRHRVVGGLPSCPVETPDAGAVAARFRSPSPAWETLRRWGRWIPGVQVERRGSPALAVEDATWRVFVTQGGYAFAE